MLNRIRWHILVGAIIGTFYVTFIFIFENTHGSSLREPLDIIVGAMTFSSIPLTTLAAFITPVDGFIRAENIIICGSGILYFAALGGVIGYLRVIKGTSRRKAILYIGLYLLVSLVVTIGTMYGMWHYRPSSIPQRAT
jgi:hypothetical protein